MNTTTLHALREHVDAIVAHIPARASRVERMREELFAHLMSIFEDEFSEKPGEQDALDAALRRFGDSELLHEELAACVPFLERTFYLFLARKEHLMWRVFMIVGVLAALIGMGLVMPAVAQLSERGEPWMLSSVLLIVGLAVTIGGLGAFAHGIKKLRAGTS